MEEPPGHPAKWKKNRRKDHRVHDSTYMKCPEKTWWNVLERDCSDGYVTINLLKIIGLNQSDKRGSGEKQSGTILWGQQIGFADRLDVRCERKKEEAISVLIQSVMSMLILTELTMLQTLVSIHYKLI